MLKDQAYHEAAIKYNEGLAEFAETLAPTLGHEEIRRWCTAVGNQHRFHAKRHQSALNKILAKQTPEQVEQVTEGLDVPEPVEDTDVDFRDAGSGQYVSEEYAEENPETTVSETTPESYSMNKKFDDGCINTHKPLNELCDFHPKGVANA